MKKEKSFINGDVVFGIVILAVCVWFYVNGNALRGVGFAGAIDAGFFPRAIAIVVALFAVALIVGAIRKPKAYFSENVDKKNLTQFLETIAATALYVGLWKVVHFIPLTLIYMLAMSWILKLKWKFALIYSVVMSVGLYLLFARVFRIILN